MEELKKRHRTVPIKESITHLGGGYPDKLCLFKIPASTYWWVRYYSSGKIVKRSTKTKDLREAKTFAKKFYEDALLRERNLLPISSSPRFDRCAAELIAEQEQRIQRGELNARLNANDRSSLKSLLTHFSGIDMRSITFKHINAYLLSIAERGLSPATQKKHLQLLSKILKLANREGLVDRLPVLPTVKLQDSPRGWFDQTEYAQLRQTVASAIKSKVVVRYHQITDELRLLITFTTNTFLRPSDLKNLRHRNVQIIQNNNRYLRISPDSSKTVNTPIVSMEDAVGIYIDLLAHHERSGNSRAPNDFLFFPALKNRDFALQTMRRQFDAILELANLKRAPSGEVRTLYSLRHTAIMFRLTKGDSIDLLTLARNCRTSVEMIERFYARPLSAEMNIEKIQSRKNSTRAKTAKRESAPQE